MTDPNEEEDADFGIDIDDFMNQRSELFNYYQKKEFSVDPCQIDSV